MKLTRIFNHLRYTTLKGHAVSRDGATIEEIDYPKVVTAINAGLVAIYSRFKLKYDEVLVRFIADKYLYELHSDFAESNLNSTETVRWIIDSEEAPFKDNFIKAHSIVTNYGSVLPINDNNDLLSVFTPSYNSIQFPNDIINGQDGCSIVYEASPDLIQESSVVAPEATEVAIPEHLLEVLCYYTASKYLEASTAQDKASKSQEFLIKYEQKCNSLEAYGYINELNPVNSNIGDNGWV